MAHEQSPPVRPLVVHRAAGPLTGRVRVPGDKSISHRALMFSGLADGTTRITGLLEGEDVLRTAAAMRALGASVVREADGVWQVTGRGLGRLAEPADVLDMGNSGTAARLLAGILASHGIVSVMTGDASLRGRPMKRVIDPLSLIGATFTGRAGGRLPLCIAGTAEPAAIRYRLPVASAQVKSAVLLAGLNAPGQTVVEEPVPTRDHSENMLRHFGATVSIETAGSGRIINLAGRPNLRARDVAVPSDPSSAAFPLVAALLVPGSVVTIEAVGLNPLRTGLLATLREMGADLVVSNERVEGGEPVGDLLVRAGPLRAVDVPAERAPSMIDEYPVLAVAAAFADGTTRLRGLGELRVKESDRLASTLALLAANGAAVTVEGRRHDRHRARPADRRRRTGGDADGSPAGDECGGAGTGRVGAGGGGRYRLHRDELPGLRGADEPPRCRPCDRGRIVTIVAGRPLVVAVDGPAAAGKGTLARALADALELPYLDTGLLYRAVGWRMLDAGLVPAEDAEPQARALTPDDLRRTDLRSPEIDRAASAVAAQPAVRSALLAFQRGFGAEHGAVLDGRDIGTVIFPHAPVKLFVTASPRARAERRWRQLGGDPALDDLAREAAIERVRAELVTRDAADSARQASPLKRAPDAVEISTDRLDAQAVLQEALRIVRQRIAAA